MRKNFGLLIAACNLIFVSSLFAVDVGMTLEQNGEYPGSDGGAAFDYTGIAVPRISGLIGDNGDFYISAGFNYQNNPWGFVPELLRTEINWSSGGVELTAGRMAYDDPLGYVASGLFDGARVTFNTGAGSFSAGAWYTGFLYKKRANIEMTDGEYESNNAALNYGDFAQTYFAPRRVLAAAEWEHKGLWERAIARLSLLGQFDLTEEKLNSQYLAGKITIPSGVFSFNLGGCFELIEANNKTGSGFALEADAELRTAVHYLSLGAKYSSGGNGKLSAFLPLTADAQGRIFEAKLSGLAVFSLDYTVRLHETFSVGLYPSYFMLTGSADDGKRMLGGEIYAELYWSPMPDIGVILGGGAYLPSLGNAAPDDDARWRVKLNIVLALF